MIMKHFKMMTEKEFIGLKALTDAGIPPSQIVKATGRSANVINWVRRSATFVDYKAINKRPTFAQAKTNGVTENKEVSETPIYDQLVEMTKVLQSIDEKLDGKKFW